jgi:hypothetical protein
LPWSGVEVRLSGSWWVFFAIIVPNINLLKYKCNFSQAAFSGQSPGVVDKFLTWTGVAPAQVGRNNDGHKTYLALRPWHPRRWGAT